jgi:hypothetical protein
MFVISAVISAMISATVATVVATVISSMVAAAMFLWRSASFSLIRALVL